MCKMNAFHFALHYVWLSFNYDKENLKIITAEKKEREEGNERKKLNTNNTLENGAHKRK